MREIKRVLSCISRSFFKLISHLIFFPHYHCNCTICLVGWLVDREVFLENSHTVLCCLIKQFFSPFVCFDLFSRMSAINFVSFKKKLCISPSNYYLTFLSLCQYIIHSISRSNDECRHSLS